MRVLLLTPPMTQINTPYPATAYLTGFLRSRGHDVRQADPAILLCLRLFSREGLQTITKELKNKFTGTHSTLNPSVRHFLKHSEDYIATVTPVIRFLQGQDPTLAHRLAASGFIPEGPRFKSLEELRQNEGEGLHWAFGSLGLQDRAQYSASLYVDDLVDVISFGIDPRFELSRYGEKLAASAPSFDPLLDALNGTPTLVDQYLDQITEELFKEHQPEVVGITVPFPGNVYGAFRIAKKLKELSPTTRVILGGGYVNTELRGLKDARVFDFVDYITLDDGERPFLSILEFLQKRKTDLEVPPVFLRTLLRVGNKAALQSHPSLHDIPFKDSATPCYDGLPLKQYLSLCELLNPMHRLWSDGRWNKLTLAHGCYWKKCSFCDTSLDYIGRYEDQDAKRIVDHIEVLIQQTGQTGFHFVDEAAPPKVLAALAKNLIDRKITISWWANIRFEKTFDATLAELLAKSGCIAVSGGLEVASDRLLKLMEKGVTVEQVARVTHAFTEAGIMVHAYLMYGFPTQTLQETIDSLERVRQLFEMGCLQSAFWHRFSATAHSPVGLNPERYGIQLLPFETNFAKNDLPFRDPVGTDHDALHPGLKKATYNYMHGLGIEKDVRDWFDFSVPKAKVARHFVADALATLTKKKTSRR